MTLPRNAWLRALAGLSINLSASWFGVAIVTPTVTDFTSVEAIVALIRNIVFGIVLFVVSAFIEGKAKR